MNSQRRFYEEEKQAKDELVHKYPESLSEFAYGGFEYYAYPVVYGSTSGPFGGLGGAAMTTFTHDAFVIGKYAVVLCKGKVIDVTDSWEGIYDR